MKPMDMAEALFGSDDDAIGKPEGSVDTSAMAAIAAHLAREDASPAPCHCPKPYCLQILHAEVFR